MTEKPGLDAAYGLQGIEANRRLYADWAETYDSSFAEAMHYILPAQVARGFAAAGGKGPVLDMGAGTGLCGAALRALGIGPLDALDLTPEMLEVARRKGLYRALFTGNLLERLPVEDNAYAGAISSGTFTHGHVGPEALPEVLRVVEPGGVVALSINAEHWQDKGYDAAFASLEGRTSGLARQEVAIYGPGAVGDHAGDRSIVVTFVKA